MAGFVITLMAAALVYVGGIPVANSAGGPGSGPSFQATNNGDAAELLAKRREAASHGSHGTESSGLRRVTMVVPACTGNEPVNGTEIMALCPQAGELCLDTPAAHDLMFWFYSGPAGVAAPRPDQWVRTGQGCLSPGDAPAAAVPALSVRDFRRLPLPPGGIRVEPPNLRTLVNVPTNLYVDAPVRTLTTTLLGRPVRVRATPVRFRWTFGDGGTLDTRDPGAPYPSLRTAHVYERPGDRDVRLVTVYRGEYSVARGPWLPVDGTAAVAGPATTLTVLAAENHLVGG